MPEKLKELSNIKIAHTRKIVTYDNDSNRLLKFVLLKIQKFLKESLRLRTKTGTIPKKISDILLLMKEVRDIENFDDIKIDSSMVLNPDYFALLKIYND